MPSPSVHHSQQPGCGLISSQPLRLQSWTENCNRRWNQTCQSLVRSTQLGLASNWRNVSSKTKTCVERDWAPPGNAGLFYSKHSQSFPAIHASTCSNIYWIQWCAMYWFPQRFGNLLRWPKSRIMTHRMLDHRLTERLPGSNNMFCSKQIAGKLLS